MRSEIDRITSALKFIPVGGHDERVRVAFMLKSALGEAGREHWDAWRGERGDDEAASVWRSASESGLLRIGSLFHEARANGWRDDTTHRPTPEELTERRRLSAEREAREEAEIERERRDTAAKAAEVWKRGSPAHGHPYLGRKGVEPVDSLKEIDAGEAAGVLGYTPKSVGAPLAGRLLVVPVKVGSGLSTLELIDEQGRKAALAGRGTKAGGYWATERLPDGDGTGLTLLLGEGVATVLSASQATGLPAVAALSCANLAAVAKAMRGRYPAAELVVLADLVKATGEPDHHAVEAARVAGAKLTTPDFGPDRPEHQKDFNDLATKCGKEAVKRAIALAAIPAGEPVQASNENAIALDSEAWPRPLPLTSRIEPEPYPLDALPDTLRAAVEEVAGFVKAPVPLVASSALAAVSLACQAHIDARRADRLEGPAGLFLLTIADSGERKSTCDGFFSQAIHEYEQAQAEKAEPVLAEYRARSEAWESKRAGLKDKIRESAKKQLPTAREESALRDLEAEKPEPPRVPRLLYADATPEALAYGLAKEWPSGGVVSAEAGIVFGSHGMGNDSVMRNLALLNQLWDGNSLTVDRRSSESFTVRGARLTVALQVQEATLRSFFDKAGALARGSGFLARFLVAWPESTQGQRPFTDPPANWPALVAFNRRIAGILEQAAPIDRGALTPAPMTLAPDAKVAWKAYYDAIESGLGSGGELHDVSDVASKTADNAVRLAALFQMFEHGVGAAISLESFRRASRVAAWHLHESRRFFGELALPPEMADAERLDRWLVERLRG